MKLLALIIATTTAGFPQPQDGEEEDASQQPSEKASEKIGSIYHRRGLPHRSLA